MFVIFGILVGKFEELNLYKRVFEKEEIFSGVMVALPLIFLLIIGVFTVSSVYSDIENYDRIEGITEVNGKLTYAAKDGGRSFIVYGSQLIGKNYLRVGYPVEIDGKLAFVTSNSTGSFVVMEGEKVSGIYNEISGLKEINDSLAFTANKGGEFFMVYKDKNVAEKYLPPSCKGYVIEIDGKLAFMVYNSSKTPPDTFILYEGETLGKEYDAVSEPKEVNGSLVYRASKDDQEILVYRGKEIGNKYDEVLGYAEVDQKLAYTAERANKTYVVFEGKENELEYETLYYTVLLDNTDKLTYLVNAGDGISVIRDGKEIYKGEGSPAGWAKYNGKLALVLYRNDNAHIERISLK